MVLRTVFSPPRARRPSPSAGMSEPTLDPRQARVSGALMRVNHVGEVCAQALYAAQALLASDAAVRASFDAAAREENDHLAWTRDRLRELAARPSALVPLWYAGSFAIGLAAGALGDRFSMGFMAETERQVQAHLGRHLERLPAEDHASRAIVSRMRDEEAHHAQVAAGAAGAPLPAGVAAAMAAAAKVMTTTAHYV